jgi:hypothetical protein
VVGLLSFPRHSRKFKGLKVDLMRWGEKVFGNVER